MPVKTVQVRDGDQLQPGWHSWADASAGPVALTLPTAGTRAITVQKLDSSSNPVNVSGLIRGVQSTLVLTGNFDLLELEPDEQGFWWVRGGHRSATSLSASTLALPTGTKAPGYAPVVQSDLSVAWAAVSGGGGGSVSDATTSAKGIVQLAGDLAGTAAAPTVPGLASKVPSTRTVAGKPLSSDVTLAKADVGLGNVDNTSDSSKPISTAQAAVNAAKADLVSGLVPSSQIPALALTTSQVVASQAAMLALTASQVQPGDIAVRTDGAGTFILNAADPSQLANWTRLNAPTDVVTTVNGQQGTVVLGKTDVGLDQVDNTTDTAKPVSTAQQSALDLKAPLASPTFTGTAAFTANVALNGGVRFVNRTVTTSTALTVSDIAVVSKATTGITITLAASSSSVVVIKNQGTMPLTVAAPSSGTGPLIDSSSTVTVAVGDQVILLGTSAAAGTYVVVASGAISTAQQAALDLKATLATIADSAFQQTAADGISLASPWQQFLTRTMRPPTKVISRFQSGHGWTSGADDTTTKLFTDRTYKVTTNGTGGNKYMTSPTFTAVNFTSSSIRIIFKVDDASKFGGLFLQAISSGGTYSSGNVPGDQVVSGEWSIVTVPRAFFGVGAGTPDWTAITAFNVAAFDKSAGACTVNLAAVELIPDLASTYPSGVMILEADDGYIGQKTYLAPVVGQRAIPVTYNVICDRFVGGTPSSGMTAADLRAFQDTWGWMIGCHGYASAAHGTGLTALQEEQDFQRNKQWLHANGLHAGADHLAQNPGTGSPAGVPAGTLMESLRRSFKSIRVNAGTVETASPGDPLRVRSRLFTGETNSQLQTLIAQVAGAGGAFVLTVHDVIAGSTNGTSNSLPAIAANNLATVLDYAGGLGMVFRTRAEWLDGR